MDRRPGLPARAAFPAEGRPDPLLGAQPDDGFSPALIPRAASSSAMNRYPNPRSSAWMSAAALTGSDNVEDQRVFHFGAISRAKDAAARRKISSSCPSVLFRLRSSRSSADSLLVTPGRTP